MNRHVKISLAVAPILGIGGYILADYFQAPKEEQQRVTEARKHRSHELHTELGCVVSTQACSLVKDDMELKLKVSGGRYWLESNRLLDGVTMTLAQGRKETRGLRMVAHDDRFIWSTRIRELTKLGKEKTLMLRLVVNRNDSFYYAAVPIDPSSLESN